MAENLINRLEFFKMHGLGNDFVVVDSRHRSTGVSSDIVRQISDRHTGIGFDQLADIRTTDDADAKIVFFNADGSESSTCGNATRCVARYLMKQTGTYRVFLETGRGRLECRFVGTGLISVNMGQPIFDWQRIPLARDTGEGFLPIEGNPMAVGFGNPHCVFLVDDADSINLSELGPVTESHPLFPERTNVEFVSVLSKSRIRMRVWERGVGVTRASGSGACAAAICMNRAGLSDRQVEVHADGGVLSVDWQSDGVWLAGPATHVFDGVVKIDSSTREP